MIVTDKTFLSHPSSILGTWLRMYVKPSTSYLPYFYDPRLESSPTRGLTTNTQLTSGYSRNYVASFHFTWKTYIYNPYDPYMCRNKDLNPTTQEIISYCELWNIVKGFNIQPSVGRYVLSDDVMRNSCLEDLCFTIMWRFSYRMRWNFIVDVWGIMFWSFDIFY